MSKDTNSLSLPALRKEARAIQERDCCTYSAALDQVARKHGYQRWSLLMENNREPVRLGRTGRARRPEAASRLQEANLHNSQIHEEETIKMRRMYLKRLPTTQDLNEIGMEADDFNNAFNAKAIPGENFAAEVSVNADGSINLNGWFLPQSTSWYSIA